MEALVMARAHALIAARAYHAARKAHRPTAALRRKWIRAKATVAAMEGRA